MSDTDVDERERKAGRAPFFLSQHWMDRLSHAFDEATRVCDVVQLHRFNSVHVTGNVSVWKQQKAAALLVA